MENLNEMENLMHLEEKINTLCDEQMRKVYKGIIDLGERAFLVNGPLYKYRDSDLIETLIEYFIEIEEYEKCSELQEVSWRLKGI
jgi:hypothetical protein